MAKTCYKCGNKISIWNDSQMVEIDNEPRELCESCFKIWQKETIKEMTQSPEGQMQLYYLGSHLIKKGVFWTIVGIITTIATFYFIVITQFPIFILFWGLIVYGVYDIFKGLYYRIKYKNSVVY